MAAHADVRKPSAQQRGEDKWTENYEPLENVLVLSEKEICQKVFRKAVSKLTGSVFQGMWSVPPPKSLFPTPL